MKNVFLLLAALATTACTSGIEIIGSGDVISSGGAWNCHKETTPCVYATNEAVDEVFTASPRGGYLFHGWENCPAPAGNRCIVQIPQSVVDYYNGQTVPSLIALFAPAGSTRVRVTSCIAGQSQSYAEGCQPFVGKTLRVTMTTSYAQVIGWDNLRYDGSGDGSNFFGSNSAGSISIVINGDNLTIASYPAGGCGGGPLTFCGVSLSTAVF